MNRPAKPTKDDHRVRVAAERRVRTRAQLIDAAVGLMAEKSPDAISIDDIVLAAGVARGTFYNYFVTSAELVRAVGAELAEDLIMTVDKVVREHPDPALRVAIGIRAILAFAQASPVLAAIIMHSGWPVAAPEHALHRVVARDIALGQSSHKFRVTAPDVAMALVGGLTVGVMPSFAAMAAPSHLAEEVAETLLLGFGLTAQEAARLAQVDFEMPLPPPCSLLTRLLALPARSRPA